VHVPARHATEEKQFFRMEGLANFARETLYFEKSFSTLRIVFPASAMHSAESSSL